MLVESQNSLPSNAFNAGGGIVSLSVKGLQNLEAVNHERDFAFVGGEGRYPCPSLVAEFLSRRVASLCSQDSTIPELSIETEDLHHCHGTHSAFSRIAEL
jgi:hypothetical protein